MTHTPTPWFYKDSLNGSNYRIWAKPHDFEFGVCDICLHYKLGEELPGKEAVANAEFIVKACNAHDELLEALEEAIDHSFYIEGLLTDQQHDLVERLEAAIAKAKKGD